MANTQRLSCVIATAATFAVCGINAARGEPDQPAAIVNYPYVVVDEGRGVDTVLQLSNSSSTSPASVRCLLEDDTSHCTDNQAACSTAAECAPGVACVQGLQLVDFIVQLTIRQPLGWRASQGRNLTPGSIPAVPENPFVGSLRCFSIDAAGNPVGLNALTGDATVEHFQNSSLDALRYSAIGLQANASGSDTDGVLVLGPGSSGSPGDYTGCPATNAITHFFEGASDPVSGSSLVETTLVLVPCSLDVADTQAGQALVEIDVTNELGQRTSVSPFIVSGQRVDRLSAIDPTTFNVALQGTLTGQTQVHSTGGLLAIAIETHRDVADPQHITSASRSPQMQGSQSTSDFLILEACVGDCNGNQAVTIDELMKMVNVGFGAAPVSTCRAGDRNGDGAITIDEILGGVISDLDGCPGRPM